MRLLWGNANASGVDIALPWSGNIDPDQSTGIRILNAGQPDDDISLSFNEYQPDANTIALWHMNEADWNGTAGEVVDATGNGHDAKSYGSATTAAEWLDRYGYFPADVDRWYTPASSDFALNDFFFATWVRIDARASAFGSMPAALALWDAGDDNCWLLGANFVTNEYTFAWWYAGEWYRCSGGTLTKGQWVHLAGWKTGAISHLYVNGVLVNTLSLPSAVVSWSSNPVASSGAARPVYYQRLIGAVDDAFIATTNPWGGEFSPHRYEAGTVVATYDLSGPHTLTEVDWAGTFGADYGRVRRVYVAQPGGWIPIGPEYPEPPITDLQYIVTGPELIKVELEPRQDTLQSETPILDWLLASLQPLAGKPSRRAIHANSESHRIAATSGRTVLISALRAHIDARSV